MAVTESALINAGVQAGLIDAAGIPQLKLQARRERIGLLEAIMRAGRFPEAALYQALADLRGIRFLLPRDLVPDPVAMDKLPKNILQRRAMVPVRHIDEQLLLALADPDDTLGLETAQRATGLRFELALAAPEALRASVRRWLKTQQQDNDTEAVVAETDATGLFDDVMKDAFLRRATDVHLEPDKQGMRVRLRVDGHLQEYHKPLSHTEGEAVITRVKVLSGLDIAEQRTAQDGGMTYQIRQWDVAATDIRVASVPTRWGERITLRLLGQDTTGLGLGRLGMPDFILEPFRAAVNRPHGIVLVTGPTGSGKSTTLYAALRELDADQLNILTVEDPVEQIIPGISQVQVSNKVDFAQALRSFLRHDPDVILVGEIRDLETAETALKAAMTGHLVLSTLHTNDAISAVTRLADIGVPHYLIGSTLSGVMAQRLVRRLCPHCREAQMPDQALRQRLGLSENNDVPIFVPHGCPVCLGTGYLGRVGLFESLWVDRALGERIAAGAREDELRAEAGERYHTLWQDGRQKIVAGLTSVAEVEHLIMGTED